MRRLAFTTAGLAFGLWLAAGATACQPAPEPESCGKFGTSVHFVATPAEAAKQAQKEEKLVFVLHVSGQFEDPGIT